MSPCAVSAEEYVCCCIITALHTLTPYTDHFALKSSSFSLCLCAHVCQDYLMALSLQQEQQSQDLQWEQLPEGISDLELAKKLQEEEDRRASQYYQEQEQEQVAAVVAAAAQAQVGRDEGDGSRREREEV